MRSRMLLIKENSNKYWRTKPLVLGQTSWAVYHVLICLLTRAAQWEGTPGLPYIRAGCCQKAHGFSTSFALSLYLQSLLRLPSALWPISIRLRYEYKQGQGAVMQWTTSIRGVIESNATIRCCSSNHLEDINLKQWGAMGLNCQGRRKTWGWGSIKALICLWSPKF